MAQQTFDRSWLTAQLAKALGWEEAVAEGIVEAIVSAQTRDELDSIIKGYMGGSQAAADPVYKFLQSQPSQLDYLSEGTRTDPRGAPVVAGQRAGGSVTVVHRQARKGKTAAHPQHSGQPKVERSVVNCLSCGKIFHPLADTPEARSLVDTGGACTFCGAQVALSWAGRSEERPPAAERRAGPAAQQSQAETPEAFKDRMVGYDRESARRTQVLDDQSDYFDVDSNAWLSAEEREQLSKQEAIIRAAEEARRRRVTVHIDLLGRQVLLADEASPSAAASPSEAAAAAEATAREIPQGGGSAVQAASAAAAAASGLPSSQGPPVFRVAPNPSLRSPAPVFIKQAAAEGAEPSEKSAGMPGALGPAQ